MQYKVAFGSSFSVDQFGFVGKGSVTTGTEVVIFSGKRGWSWYAKLGAFVPLTILLLRIGLLFAALIALVVVYYFCTSRGSLEIDRSSITKMHRQGRWIRFAGQHPGSGKVKQTVFKVDTEQGAASLEYELSANQPTLQKTADASS